MDVEAHRIFDADDDRALYSLLWGCPVTLSESTSGTTPIGTFPGFRRGTESSSSDTEDDMGMSWELTRDDVLTVHAHIQRSVLGVDRSFFDEYNWEETIFIRAAERAFDTHRGDPYYGVTSDIGWRFHECVAADMAPHSTRFAWICPIAYGPARIMAELERRIIRRINVDNLMNEGDGGERIGAGYQAFIYLRHN